MSDKKLPLSIVFAIADHPWVDSADGAAVRIAITVAEAGTATGNLCEVVSETIGAEGAEVILASRVGSIHSDLSIGANISACLPLRSNLSISGMGVALHGSGFLLEPNLADEIRRQGPSVIRRFLSGRDVMQKPRIRYVVDFSDMDENAAKAANPAAYQHVLHHVKPERDQNKRKSIRDLWWRFGWERPLVRRAIRDLRRYIVTVETAKYRLFVFADRSELPEHRLIVFAIADAALLAVMSSSIHWCWALAAGGTLEDRPVYNKTRCFDPFPFPVIRGDQSRLRNLGEQLDATRKRQQSAFPELTLTDMYNVLTKLRNQEVLSAKERTIHDQGLVSVLRQLHDDLDAAVLDAYGWSDLLPLLHIAHAVDASYDALTRDDTKRIFDETIVERLVALNASRVAEEARGLVRWLRPEFQAPSADAKPVQDELVAAEVADAESEASVKLTPNPTKPALWPKDTLEQVRAVADVLGASPAPLSIDDIAARFNARGAWKKRLPQLLYTLVNLGRAREYEGRYSNR